MGIFDCVTKIVPSLKAPGFCNAETDDLIKTAPSASKWLADSILLKVKSTKPYGGFKFSFAADVLDRQFKSYARALFRSLPRPGCSRRNL